MRLNEPLQIEQKMLEHKLNRLLADQRLCRLVVVE